MKEKLLNKRNGSIVLALVLTLVTVFSITGAMASYAAAPTDTVNFGTSFAQKTGRIFWSSDDPTYAGYCMDGGLDIPSGSNADVQEVYDGTDPMVQLLYNANRLGWYRNTSVYKKYGGKDWTYSRWLNIMLQVGNYHSSRSYAQVEAAMNAEGYSDGLLDSAKEDLARYLADPEFNKPVPESFKVYICGKSSSKQRFVLFPGVAAPGYVKVVKVSGNTNITG